MRTAGVFEAKQNFSELIAAVEAGEAVTITRHGKAVVQMVPASAAARGAADRAEETLARLHALRQRIKPGPGWRELRDEGRRF